MSDFSEIIVFNECANTGDRVYTYHNEKVGAMEAFGYSAYMVSKLVNEVLCMWDDKVDMPCVVLRKLQMEDLLLNGKVDESGSTPEIVQVNLTTPTTYDKVGYEQWLEALKSHKNKTASIIPAVVGSEDTLLGSHGKDNMVVIVFLLVIVFIVAFVLALGSGLF